MVDTTAEIIYPFRMISFIFGSGIYVDRSNRSSRLSLLYTLVLWSFYLYLFYFINERYSKKSAFPHMITLFMILSNVFVAFVFMVVMFCANKKFDACMKRLDFVNDTLEQFGIRKEYRKLQKSMNTLLIVWFAVVCVTMTFDALWCVEIFHDTSVVLIPLIMDYHIHVNFFIDVMFIFLLRYIGDRFDEINDYIRRLADEGEYGLRCTWRKSVIRYYADKERRRRVLWTAMHLHSELCRIARDINSLFGIHMTLQMMTYFVVLTGLIYFQYYMLLCLQQIFAINRSTTKLLLSNDTWFLVFLARLITINYICESVSAKARKTIVVMHNLTNLIRFAEAREEICQFALQLSLRPLKFNGLGLFYFGYTFIGKFFIRILTFIIIMMQMDTFSIYQVFERDIKNITCYVYL